MEKVLKWRKECRGLYFAEFGFINFEVCQTVSELFGKRWKAHWFNEKSMLHDCATKEFNLLKDAKEWCEIEAIKRKYWSDK